MSVGGFRPPRAGTDFTRRGSPDKSLNGACDIPVTSASVQQFQQLDGQIFSIPLTRGRMLKSGDGASTAQVLGARLRIRLGPQPESDRDLPSFADTFGYGYREFIYGGTYWAMLTQSV